MLTALSMAALATSLALPSAGEKLASQTAKPRVEMVIDRGPIYELVTACGGGGTAIVSYAKLERLYCTPQQACAAELARVIAKSCR